MVSFNYYLFLFQDHEMTEPAPAIGIDLGTTNSCVAVMRYGKIEVIANEQGNFTTPSYVAFNEHERLVGDAAKNEIVLNPSNTVFDAKRLIGRKFDDSTVQADMKHWPFIVKNINKEPHIQLISEGQTKLFLPEEISAMVLSKMKETAESYLNQEVTNAVITVPAYFNNAQRQATFDAGRVAGLNILRIINEPTAAAIGFSFDNHDFWNEDLNILVFDLGGGTFDVTVLLVNKNYIKVKASNGDTHLGGEDFDCRLVEFCVEDFKKKHNRDVQNNNRAMRRLRSACERAKRELSSAIHTKIVVDALVDGIDYSVTMTRPRFNDLNAVLFKKTLVPVQLALDDAKLTKSDIHKVVLVGGSTRIPQVQKMLQDFFDGKELDKTINPDEAVAYGAAIQAAALNGNKSERILGRVLQDVTPLSLGIGSREDRDEMSVVIPRNTPIPVQIKKTYTTFYDNQTTVRFQIRQGESPNALQNFLLGEFKLTGFPIAPKGVPKFDVTFQINENGILTVTARDTATGATNGITIENVTGRLKKEQIEKMIEDNESYREKDLRRKKIALAKNALENECYQIKGAICEDLDAFPEDERVRVFKECDDMLTWIEENSNEPPKAYEERRSEIMNFAQSIFNKFKTIFTTK